LTSNESSLFGSPKQFSGNFLHVLEGPEEPAVRKDEDNEASPIEVPQSRPVSRAHRTATCFGLKESLKSYSLPIDESILEPTISKDSLPSDLSGQQQPAVLPAEPSVSHLEKLMQDFGYLGDCVV
jgi:hypothetical protein